MNKDTSKLNASTTENTPAPSLYDETLVKMKSTLEKMNDFLDKSHQNRNFKETTLNNNNSEEAIDPYEGYLSLSLKPSSHEDVKPLSNVALFKKDIYCCIFSFFIYLYVYDTANRSGENAKSKLQSKWMSLLGMSGNERLRQFAHNVSKDRQLLSQNQTIFQCDDGFILKKAEELLPGKLTTDGYISFFFKNIWPMRPFIDEEDFSADINRILSYDPKTSKAVLSISKRSDMVIVSQLLIILRYSHVVLSLIDQPISQLENEYQFLIKQKISAEFIKVAHLSFYVLKVTHKATTALFQTLLLYRYYLSESPEGGDGINLTHSQPLTGLLMESALTIGLNRDPSTSNMATFDLKMINLRRRLWFGLVSLKSSSAVLNGLTVSFPKSKSVNVEVPALIDPYDLLESEQRCEYEKSKVIDSICRDISDLFNQVDEKVKVFEIISLLDQWANYLKENYELKHLPDSTSSPQLYQAVHFSNIKFIQRKLVCYSVEINIFHTLCTHYESTAHLDKEKYFHYLKRLLVSTTSAIDLSMAYLKGQLAPYITSSSYFAFAISPMVTTTLLRVHTILMSHVLHLYHCQQILSFSSIGKNSELCPTDLEPLCIIITRQLQLTTSTLHETLASQYWIAFKLSVAFKFSMEMLTSHRFESINQAIKFFSGEERNPFCCTKPFDNSTIDKLHKLTAEPVNISVADGWRRINDDIERNQDVFVGTNHKNLFVYFSKEEVLELKNISDMDFIYLQHSKNQQLSCDHQTSNSAFSNSSAVITPRFPDTDQVQPSISSPASKNIPDIDAELLVGKLDGFMVFDLPGLQNMDFDMDGIDFLNNVLGK